MFSDLPNVGEGNERLARQVHQWWLDAAAKADADATGCYSAKFLPRVLYHPARYYGGNHIDLDFPQIGPVESRARMSRTISLSSPVATGHFG